ncbi:hypothetical protein DPMN_053220 [Dreissena polymorpha]|uniref:Uncharacterized protein n=1 Tax=Dreissena polymorpha TaxID=45954 RepID=A0A9D4CKZ1_DREPO|nr:hypothetical protein DPMN_053220 [Dreissena polymorpha]
MVETGYKINFQVKSLQFDPVSTRTNEADVIDRWIVTFDTQVSCERAIERGLSVGGDRVVVRDWDAILREECGLEEWHWSKGGYRLKAHKHQWALQKFLNAH